MNYKVHYLDKTNSQIVMIRDTNVVFPIGQLLLEFISLDLKPIKEKVEFITDILLSDKPKTSYIKIKGLIKSLDTTVRNLHPYFHDYNVIDYLFEYFINCLKDNDLSLNINDCAYKIWDEFNLTKSQRVTLNNTISGYKEDLGPDEIFLDDEGREYTYLDFLIDEDGYKLLRYVDQEENEVLVATGRKIKFSHDKYTWKEIITQKRISQMIHTCFVSDEYLDENYEILKNMNKEQRFIFLWFKVNDKASYFEDKLPRFDMVPIAKVDNVQLESILKKSNLEFKEFILNNEFDIASLFICDSIRQICYVDFIKMFEHNIIVKKCSIKSCNKLFIPEGRIDTLYCESCQIAGGAKLAYKEKIAGDGFLKLLNKEYQRRYAKIRNYDKGMKKAKLKEVQLWVKKAKTKMDEPNLTIEQFEKWIETEKESEKNGR